MSSSSGTRVGWTAGVRPSQRSFRDVGLALVAFRVPADTSVDELPLPDGTDTTNGRISFSTATPTRDLAPLMAWASRQGVELEGLTVTRPTLEDVYLELTNTDGA